MTAVERQPAAPPGRPPGPPATTDRPRRPRQYTVLGLVAAVAFAVVWAAWTSGIDPRNLVTGPERLGRIVWLMFTPPEVGVLPRALAGMVESVQIAWLGTLIGAAISLPLGVLASGAVGNRALALGVRQVLNALRAFPELILAIIFVSIVGLGPQAGAIAIGIGSIGTLGKLTAEVIEGIDRGPTEAVRSSGAGSLQVTRWSVLPQALPEIVALWLYRFEINVRASAILGIVGAGGVGGVLQDYLVYRRWPEAGMTILVVIAITILIDAVSARLRRRIIHG